MAIGPLRYAMLGFVVILQYSIDLRMCKAKRLTQEDRAKLLRGDFDASAGFGTAARGAVGKDAVPTLVVDRQGSGRTLHGLKYRDAVLDRAAVSG